MCSCRAFLKRQAEADLFVPKGIQGEVEIRVCTDIPQTVRFERLFFNNLYSTQQREFAIKKFKADKEGEVAHYTGISQSACREIALCRELRHTNITTLTEIILEDKCIYMVFEFAEHDLLV